MSTTAKKKKASKKATKVTGPVKSTIASLIAEGKKYGFSLTDKYADDNCYDDNNAGGWQFEYHNKNGKGNNFSFQTNQVPFCCGVAEIGELNIYDRIGLTPRQKEELDVLIAFGLLSIKEGYVTRKATKNNPAQTFGLIINTNGEDTSVHVDRAIGKYLSNHFKLATTFENKNSGNIIKTFVSIY